MVLLAGLLTMSLPEDTLVYLLLWARSGYTIAFTAPAGTTVASPGLPF